MPEDLPNWARGILDRELAGVDLAQFYVLKETPLEKLGVGYTTRETYLLRKSLTQEEIYRLARPADVFGEQGERVGCERCGAVFRLWRRSHDETVHCFECGEPVSAHVEPVGHMTPFEDTLPPASTHPASTPAATPAPATRARAPATPVAAAVPPSEADLEEEAIELSRYPAGPGVAIRGGVSATPTPEPHSPLLTRQTASAPLREAALGHPAASVEDSDILEIEGIGPTVLHRLGSMGIASLSDLARADPQEVARACEIPLAVARTWQGQADLLRLGTIGSDEAHLLVQGGIDGAADLARREPGELARTLRERGAPVSEDLAERWVRDARTHGGKHP